MNPVTIKLLNHASAMIHSGDFSLVSDPWYEGTAFSGGWGLQYINPGALREAAQCRYLWISHFHNDHLHIPTLKKLSESNPDLVVFTNPSANFDTRDVLGDLGFRKFIPLPERKAVEVGKGVSLTRYPTTGIDNMLVIRLGDFTVLNYNDCNIPRQALQRLMQRIGRVDLLLINFNHAGKLIQSRSVEEIRKDQKLLFQKSVEAINPGRVIPFASMHYYRSPYSKDQNASLWSANDISHSVSKTTFLSFGDSVTLQGGSQTTDVLAPPLSKCPYETQEYHRPCDWNELAHHAERFCHMIHREFMGIVFWIWPVTIWVDDCQRGLRIDFKRKSVSSPSDLTREQSHFCSHSEALMNLFGKPFGPIDFQVGAHYQIIARKNKSITRMLFASGLIGNSLSLRKILKMLFTIRGWKFFFNRREEIFSVIFNARFDIESRL